MFRMGPVAVTVNPIKLSSAEDGNEELEERNIDNSQEIDTQEQVLDKCHNCGILLKPNHRDHCKARSFVCHNCNCRGLFARFC